MVTQWRHVSSYAPALSQELSHPHLTCDQGPISTNEEIHGYSPILHLALKKYREMCAMWVNVPPGVLDKCIITLSFQLTGANFSADEVNPLTTDNSSCFNRRRRNWSKKEWLFANGRAFEESLALPITSPLCSSPLPIQAGSEGRTAAPRPHKPCR